MNFINAVKTLRKELLIKDEPLKAYNLLKELALPELSEELKNTRGMIGHVFSEDIYQKVYGMHYEDKTPDCEIVEPRFMIKNSAAKYARYQWIVEDAKVSKPKTYCDLACYVGSQVTTLANMGIDSVGVDMTASVIDVARDRAKSENIKNATFHCADITKWEGGPFEMLSAFEVLEHVPDPAKFIKHISNLCTGWIYITTPDGPYGDGIGNRGHWEWDGIETHTRGHVVVFTKDTLGDLLKDYEVERLTSEVDGLLWAKFRRKQ